MKRLKPLRKTTVLIIVCILFLGGLAFARTKIDIASTWLLISGAVALGFVGQARRLSIGFVVSLCAFAFVAGWWQGSVFMDKLAVYDQFYRQTVVVEAMALEDAVYSERGQLMFIAGDIRAHQPYAADLIGEMVVEGRGASMVYRGDIVRISGKIHPRRGAQASGIGFANIEVITHNNSLIEKIRREFFAGMQNSLPEPLASFAVGLLIGQRNTLPESVNEELTTTGLVHIVAVSGYNLTVLTHITQRLFARRSRFQALAFSLFLIGLFLLFTGYSPSIVRAAIVSTLGLVTWFFGRQMRPLLLLLLSAVLTAGVYPPYLWSNIGWYLSFMAFFGVLIVAPLFKERFLKKAQREKIVPTILSETLAAQLCTLPIILFIFGRLSIISIVANLLIVPFVPFAMFFSLIAGISGMIGFGFNGLIALPAKILLNYILDTARILSKIPYASVEFIITWWQMACFYIAIIVFAYTIWKGLPKQHATITDEKE